jgi:hypothetical protein
MQKWKQPCWRREINISLVIAAKKSTLTTLVEHLVQIRL